MSTSSSDRCTRISPSAVLDDRLHGKDLEWARDHLRRCEPCRERVEDFREMMMRVGRLPSAQIGAPAMDEAFARSIPEPVRAGASHGRDFDVLPLPINAAAEPLLDLPPQPVRPEVTNVRDLMSDLEREIFRDEPAQDHPTAMPAGLATLPAATEPPAAIEPPIAIEPPAAKEPEPAVEPVATLEPVAAVEMAPATEPAPIPPPPPEIAGPSLREVDLNSRAAASPQPDPFDVAPVMPPSPSTAPPIHDQEPAEAPPPFVREPIATPAGGRSDTVMRVAVGLGAAACVLLAAFLYEGGLLSRGTHKASATVPPAGVSARALPRASSVPPASASAAPTAPPAPVLFRLGDGVTGGTVYRIRPGTAVAGYTRLVFDIRGRGLPAMVISQPDAMHVAITFAGTTGAAVPVNGIRSFQVAAVEPATEQGSDLVITIDLARPDRVTAFTLPASGAYTPRLVVDLHTS